MPLYQPGDKVTLTFSNGSAKEYEILAMAEIPTAVGDQSYGYPFDIECILPAGELKAQEGERQPTRVIFDAKKGYEDAVTSWLKEFCGGQVLNNFEAPIWKLPVFVKKGAVIPTTPAHNTPKAFVPNPSESGIV